MHRSLMCCVVGFIIGFHSFVSAKKLGRHPDDAGSMAISRVCLTRSFPSGWIGRSAAAKPSLFITTPRPRSSPLMGSACNFLDISDIGKYATVSGEMVDNQLEAKVISVTSGNGQKKSKSKN